jgi:NAD(P)-dependent dehydrogenase (short-subunit alcohol dehydrogenase family)
MTDRASTERMQIALVTGANKGIGKEISRQLSAKGVHVLMGARDWKRGEKTVAELRARGLPVEFLNVDVTSQTSVDAAASGRSTAWTARRSRE